MSIEHDPAILHPHYESGRDEVIRLAKDARDGTFIFVIGLAGSGKSMMLPVVMRELVGMPDTWQTATLPAITIKTAVPDNGFYSPKDTMVRLYDSLSVPEMDWLDGFKDSVDLAAAIKSDLAEIAAKFDLAASSESEPKLRRLFAPYARSRKVRFVLIDDANAIRGTKRSASPLRLIRSYMHLATASKTVWILFGTEEMAALSRNFGEVRRRTKTVYVGRYKESVKKDFEALVKLHKNISCHLKFSSLRIIEKHFGEIHASTGGIFEEIRMFYERAEENRAKASRSTITSSDLLGAVYSDEDIKKLWAEIASFDALQVPGNPTELASTFRSMWASAKVPEADEAKLS